MEFVTGRLWAVGSGKGGVGKSFLTSSMAMVLARMGKSVIAVDADLGAGNLHTFLGIKSPNCTLLDYLAKRSGAEEILLQTTQPGLRMISCAGSNLGSADLIFKDKEKIIRFITELEADCILVDLGSGTMFNVLDFFNISDEGIAVASPDPASIQNAYGFIKSAIFRRIQRKFSTNRTVMRALKEFHTGAGDSRTRTMMDFYDILCTTEPEIAERVAALVDSYRPLMIINMAESEGDQRVAEIIQSTSKRFLNVDIRFCGLIFTDPAVRRASQRMTSLDFDDPGGVAARQIRQTVQRLMNGSAFKEPADIGSPVPATPIMGLNDDLEIMGNQLHIQTEDLGYTGRCITTQVFCSGRVILSTKSAYPATIIDGDDRGQVMELMRRQHFNVIRELESKKVRLLRPA